MSTNCKPGKLELLRSHMAVCYSWCVSSFSLALHVVRVQCYVKEITTSHLVKKNAVFIAGVGLQLKLQLTLISAYS